MVCKQYDGQIVSLIFHYSKLGCLCLSIIHSQDTVPELADIEPHQDDAVQVGLSVDDDSVQQMNNTNNIVGNEDIATRIIPTTIQTPVPFSCHECTNCNSKSDYLPHVCDSGIKMCYVGLFFGLILIIYSFVFFSHSIENGETY